MRMKLEEIYHGMELPGKFKMAVSGCNLNCAESWVRDVSLFGKPNLDKRASLRGVGSPLRAGGRLVKPTARREPYRVEKLNRHSFPVTRL